jgi:hypothetical protein
MYSEAKLAFIIYLWYPKTKVCAPLPGSMIVKVYWFLLHAENLRSLMVAIFCFGITLGVDLRNCPLLPNKESAAFWV